MSILLEVAIASVEDAIAAEQGGANRVELNSALPLGGLTPSLGTYLEVREAIQLPIIVMIRPRSSGFAYSDADFNVMLRDVEIFQSHGVDGIAVGVLNDDATIDVSRCRELINRTAGLELVFHRALDVTPDPFIALEQLIDLGIHRVMTSGQEASTYNGTSLISQLIEKAAGRIEILPAGGINRFTIDDILTRTGCNQVHASLSGTKRDHSVEGRPQIHFGAMIQSGENQFKATNQAAVIEMCQRIKKRDNHEH